MTGVHPVRRLLTAAAYGAVEVGTLGRGVPRRVCGERVRFPARWFRYYPRVYEPYTFDFLRQHTRIGSTAVDVGAHIGLFTILLARLVGPHGRVISFEPSATTRRVLVRTVALNRCESRVVVRSEAVAGKSGTRLFHESNLAGCNANSLVVAGVNSVPVPTATASVDGCLSRDASVSCLKIDAEGAELEVLRGAAETIATWRPAISLAVHPDALLRAGATLRELWEEIDRHDMAISHSGQIVARGWFESQRQLVDVQLTPR